MLALGQVKALQVEQKRKAQLIDKATNPPMVAPTSLKNQRVSLLPGDVTYLDVLSGGTVSNLRTGKPEYRRSAG